MKPLPFAEMYKIKMVELIRPSTREEREQWIKEAHYNLFNLSADKVFIDLLTDSGTGAMSDRQWAALMLGDESYAGSRSYYRLKDTIEDIFGFPYFMPTHQGRAAENVLFSTLIKPGDIIPGNSHFDTTKGHIMFRKARAIDCTIDEAFDTDSLHPFKGNVDINKLEKVFRDYPHDRIPFIIVTITNNTAGGQPVSMENIKQISDFAKEVRKPLLIDSARFAENAYFIKQREPGYEDWSIKDIVREIYSHANMMTMSSKKDGHVNIGGFIAMRDEKLWRDVSFYNIMFEGFVTYGGMAGRDMEALAVGLQEAIDYNYLQTRIAQVRYLGQKLIDAGIPVQKPIGGHAVFVDALKFLPHIPREQFVAQTLAVELYLEAGVRGVEIGTLLADRDPDTRENIYPNLELVRLSIPRRVYTNNHMDVVAVALENLYERRNEIRKGFEIIWEAPLMRHFTVKLKRSE
ncbi:MAG: tryptophanase [Bacteroidales bacterium]|nr:tryptophanase [Bacteroidales bacterium]